AFFEKLIYLWRLRVLQQTEYCCRLIVYQEACGRVNGKPDDALRSCKLLDRFACKGVPHEIGPYGSSGPSADFAPAEGFSHIVKTDPHTSHQLRRVAGKPCVLVV